MSMFPAISIAETGADAMQTWINTSAGNIANMNDVAAAGSKVYAEQTPVLEAMGRQDPGDGVEVQSIALGTSKGIISYEPTSPVADAKGEVATPNISLADQMVGMIEAQESYGADTSIIQKAQTAYQAGLDIGS